MGQIRAAYHQNVGKQLEVVVPSDMENELVDNFVVVITSMAARIYERRNSKHKTERLRAWIEQVIKEDASCW